MNQYPKTCELGTLKTAYENNPAHAKNLLGFIILFGLAGAVMLIIGIGQSHPRDRLLPAGGGLLLLFVGAKLFFDFRSRLNVSAAVYEAGFMFTNRRKQRIACRWDAVTEVYETITYSGSSRNRRQRWRRYTVHQIEGQPIKLDNAIMRVRKLGKTIQDEVNNRLLPQALERYKAGKTVMFGPQIGLSQQGIACGQKLLSWEQTAEIRFTSQGSLEIKQKGSKKAWRTVFHPKIANYPTLKAMINRVVEQNPPSMQPPIRGAGQKPAKVASRDGFSPAGSIGDLSARLGYDVRELMMAGYTLQQIYGVSEGEYTLQELLQSKPKGRATRIKR